MCGRVCITHTIHSYTQTQKLLLVRQGWKSEVPHLQGASGMTCSETPLPDRRPGSPRTCHRSHCSSQASQPRPMKTIRPHQRKSYSCLSTRTDGGPLKHAASLVARLLKSLPAVRETWVRSLGWEDPLEKETATHSSILAWRAPMDSPGEGGNRTGSILKAGLHLGPDCGL